MRRSCRTSRLRLRSWHRCWLRRCRSKILTVGRPLADTTAIEVAAVALKRWRSVHSWCEMHGRFTEKGEVKSAARYEMDGERALQRCLDSLGMSPMARSKLGLNIAPASSFDLAQSWAGEGDPPDAEVVDGDA